VRRKKSGIRVQRFPSKNLHRRGVGGGGGVRKLGLGSGEGTRNGNLQAKGLKKKKAKGDAAMPLGVEEEIFQNLDLPAKNKLPQNLNNRGGGDVNAQKPVV